MEGAVTLWMVESYDLRVIGGAVPTRKCAVLCVGDGGSEIVVLCLLGQSRICVSLTC